MALALAMAIALALAIALAMAHEEEGGFETMTLKLCVRCVTMKNIKGKKDICARCLEQEGSRKK
jgi:hypothetical protein